MSTIFLDRDDTLIRCTDLPEAAWAGGRRGDTGDPRWVEPLPGAIDACYRLVNAGFALVVITNQGAVARGHFSLERVAAVNRRVSNIFSDPRGNPVIRAFYACPFHPVSPEGPFHREHPWRKPAGGMLRAAMRELALGPGPHWMIGDAARDVDAGLDAGIPPERCRRVGPEGDHPDLAAVADEILGTGRDAARDHTASCEAPKQGEASRRSSSSTPSGVAIPSGVTAPTVSVTLRALRGTPLADSVVRGTILSTAHAIAERTGVALVSLDAEDDRVIATLATHRLAAIGFGAELRRLTNRWHEQKFGTRLWDDPTTDW